MKQRALSAAVALLSLFTLASFGSPARAVTLIPAHHWSAAYGDQRAVGVALDPGGNIYMAGYFFGSVNFGGGDLVSAGGYDIYLVKFTPTGAHLWSKRFGDTNDQSAAALAVDAGGNVWITGSFNGTTNFGGNDLTSAGQTDIYIAAFNTAGAHQWSRGFGDASIQIATSIAVDNAGYAVITGYFYGTLNLGGGGLVSAGNEDIFLARYSSAGGHVWSRRYGDANHQRGIAVATDASRNIILTGMNAGTVDFGGGTLNSPDNQDVFLAKFDAGSNHEWSKIFGDGNQQNAMALAIDGAGFIYLTGYFSGTINFGGNNLVNASGVNIFLAKFNPGGLHQWSQRYGDVGTQRAYSVATAAGTVCITGSSTGSVDFGGGSLVSQGGSEDAYLACFRWSGEHLWSQRYGDADFQEGRGVAMDAEQNVALCGHFLGAMNLGGDELTNTDGAMATFLARFNGLPLEPVITSIRDVGNDQGRKVRLRIAKSGLDHSGSPVLGRSYEIYRRNEPAAPAPGWVYVGDTPAHGVGVYEVDASTDVDSSITDGAHYSAFFVRLTTDDPYTFYDSPVDSGCSIDNLSPGVPGMLSIDGGVLSWSPPGDPDLDHFTVYGSNTSSFASATELESTRDDALDIGTRPHAFYFVTAVDVAGNEGPPATLLSAGGTTGPPRTYALSISAHPNPFNPSTTLRYTLPASGNVVITIHDVRGTRVAELVDGHQQAGAFTTTWNGLDDAGRPVSSGLYLARIQHAAGTMTCKMLLLK